MNDILNAFKNQREYEEISRALKSESAKNLPMLVTGLCEGAREVFLAALTDDRKIKTSPLLVLFSQEKEINRMAPALEEFGIRVKVFPVRDYNMRNISASHEFEHERLSALHAVLENKCDVVLTTPDAALSYTMPREVLKERVKRIKVSDTVDIDALCEWLGECGYLALDAVEASGQFSRRGGILDIFSTGAEEPTRIEFFGDEIDRMSSFDIMSQRRTEDINELFITPSREVALRRSQREKLVQIIKQMISKASDPHIKDELKGELEALISGREISSLDKYISFVYPEKECLFDYFDPYSSIVYFDYSALIQRVKGYEYQEIENDKAAIESGLANGKYIEHTLGLSAFEEIMRGRKNIIVNSFAATMSRMELSGIYTFVSRQTPSFTDNLGLLVEELEGYKRSSYKIVLLCEGEQNIKNMKALLEENCISSSRERGADVRLVSAPELCGFELTQSKFVALSVSRTGQGVGAKKKRAAKRTKAKSAQNVLTYTDLHEGDYVVHTVHGIGMYLGLDSLLVAGVRRDFVKIKYAGDDMLYLPCNQLDNLSKYIGAEKEANIKLSKMGGGEWQKSKTKVKTAAKAMAKELIKLYAERVRREGFAFAPDDAVEREFADTFEYEETEGQLDAIEDIKRDMQSPWPMDRLLCGDVGYGKTEVALRAAFKAATNSKQVAILVPTTILALQHYQTMMSRMRGFPINIDMISRFRTPKQQAASLERLERGEIDIIVGTHRLLSKDVKFHDLGLVIVDEEQRFGVAQKEKLKQLVKNVDVLTLTATPIPRTLNMAMSGIRDMSILEEAPGDRLPVQTYVCEYDRGIISEAIKKELRRGGQVFYLCNVIERAEKIIARLREDIPEARVMVANGQMDKELLSDIWQQMISGDIDILVCTTIIETGIDVANANTLIVEDADKMGLSQLHQLRGRVGRSSRRAYAYFTYPQGKVLTDVSEKRLEAIKDFTEFGAGFKIAMRDLEIRGAGDLLGAEQHGNIISVGYEMYMKLLNDAILEEKGAPTEKAVECNVVFNVDAYIPESYISSQNGRIEAYKKISLIRNEGDMLDVTDELIDRYGDMPKVADNLIKISLIRALGSEAGVTKAEYRAGALTFYLAKPELKIWTALAIKFNGRLLISNSSKPYVSCRTLKNEKISELAIKLLSSFIEIRDAQSEKN